jgi:hypothetical protein
MDDQGLDRRDYPRASKYEFSALMLAAGCQKKVTERGTAYTGIKLTSEAGQLLEDTEGGKVHVFPKRK